MIYIKTTHVGALAQAAADRQLHVSFAPSLEEGCTRVTAVQDVHIQQLAYELDAVPEPGKRWPGDTGTRG